MAPRHPPQRLLSHPTKAAQYRPTQGIPGHEALSVPLGLRSPLRCHPTVRREKSGGNFPGWPGQPGLMGSPVATHGPVHLQLRFCDGHRRPTHLCCIFAGNERMALSFALPTANFFMGGVGCPTQQDVGDGQISLGPTSSPTVLPKGVLRWGGGYLGGIIKLQGLKGGFSKSQAAVCSNSIKFQQYSSKEP